jgi:hypothetical protein
MQRNNELLTLDAFTKRLNSSHDFVVFRHATSNELYIISKRIPTTFHDKKL